jgi:hypothetical protein
MLWHLYTHEKDPQYPLDGRLGGWVPEQVVQSQGENYLYITLQIACSFYIPENGKFSSTILNFTEIAKELEFSIYVETCLDHL